VTVSWRPIWLERERRTGLIVRACYDRIRAHRVLDAEELHALCRLTWITKSNGSVGDTTRSVVAPALSTLLAEDLTATNAVDLVEELRALELPDAIVGPVSGGVGIVNFYNGFRKTSLSWIEEHLDEVSEIVEAVAHASNDQAVQAAYARIDALPSLPRPGGGDMPCFNLLTPMLACLDPRRRAPIINGRKEVLKRLGMLGLSSATLEERCVGLQGLIGQAGIGDAFALDTADDEAIRRAIAAAEPTAGTGPEDEEPVDDEALPTFAPLAERCDDDVEYLRATDPVRMAHRHHTMTNALREICARAKLHVEEGTDPSCFFDALIREYLGTQRHLLVEVKTDVAPPFCRLAVGQLLDYRRKLPGAAAIDLAVLLPSKPPQDILDFLGYVGVRALWLNITAKRIEGDVLIGGT
jgi:hypothetical protein